MLLSSRLSQSRLHSIVDMEVLLKKCHQSEIVIQSYRSNNIEAGLLMLNFKASKSKKCVDIFLIVIEKDQLVASAFARATRIREEVILNAPNQIMEFVNQSLRQAPEEEVESNVTKLFQKIQKEAGRIHKKQGSEDQKIMEFKISNVYSEAANFQLEMTKKLQAQIKEIEAEQKNVRIKNNSVLPKLAEIQKIKREYDIAIRNYDTVRKLLENPKMHIQQCKECAQKAVEDINWAAVKDKGSFEAAISKIIYLKELSYVEKYC